MNKDQIINRLKELKISHVLIFEDREFNIDWLKDDQEYDIIEDGDSYTLQNVRRRSFSKYFWRFPCIFEGPLFVLNETSFKSRNETRNLSRPVRFSRF